MSNEEIQRCVFWSNRRRRSTLAKCIKKAELIAYEDLGAEALQKLYVEEMPLVVVIDSEGNNLYEEGRAAYLQKKEKKRM
ncbi:MAG: fumarate hydratase C-terminal domain-containing protein [Lachnospiraceae bacterium]